ncbi:MAG: hydantoinase B/oxoprolinase family protein [Microbispora sp.]|nr:hydantoinase B/oxoprolinase family protein [Microbispora sp.]
MTASIAETSWDGVGRSYIPDHEIRISPAVALHRETAEDVDPISYEVIRHNLWNINEEHGSTIVKVSGSPIAVFAHDFNPSILTEDGEFVFFGPYLQFHAGMLDLNVKWTLENRSEHPGIRDGDMFFANDPWVGTTHQQDAAMMCPVFWEGRIFCWVANLLHFADVGGGTPGSFCPEANDVFEEPVPTPPLRMVENGEIRPDLEAQFLRRSRLPELCALDLRAVVAGNTVAKNRILALVERYGPGVVKGVMRRVISAGEERFVRRLERLPDGVWRDVNFLEVAKTGDRRAYKIALEVRKEGDRLIFSNRGTDPQTGAINITYAALRGGIMCPINAFFLHDSLYAIGGALRHIDIEPEPGTITCADYPAACSNGGSTGVHIVIGLAVNVLAKMLACDTKMARSFCCQGGATQWPGATMSGKDRRGNDFGAFLLDPMAGAIGAFSFRDGVDVGGLWFDAKGTAPNVEHNEWASPALFLYRREKPDSGGAGKFRGGNSLELAWVPHKTDVIMQTTTACGCAIPTARGLFGGLAGSPNRYDYVEGSDVQERLRGGTVPQDLDELRGRRRELLPKETGIAQTVHDVYQLAISGAAGYGDPIDRDPEAVARDLAAGLVTPETARRFYGVVVDAAGHVDEEATAHRREEIREERRASAERPS